MDLTCPGRKASAPKDSIVVACPSCGREVELFDDEPRVRCRCGQWVFRKALPSCVQWCAAAKLCLGEAGPLEQMKPPHKQTNYQQAYEKAFQSVRKRSPESLVALGAREAGPGRYELPVLDGVLLIDLERGTVGLSNGKGGVAEDPIRIDWQILALRYLSATAPRMGVSSWVSFAEIPGAMGYDPVYRGRVLGRLAATAGRNRAAFVQACGRVGAERFEGMEVGDGRQAPILDPASPKGRGGTPGAGDEAFRFRVFPGFELAIVWFAGDEDLASGVSFLYPDNISSFLSVEDVVVLAEGLVRRLGASRTSESRPDAADGGRSDKRLG